MKRRAFALFLCLATLSTLAFARAEAPQVVSVTLTRGTAPVGENQTVTTYTDVPVSGMLTGVDPDGDKLSFRLITAPKKGTVTVESDGSFLYTPKENRRGRDTFSFVARDNVGNESATAVVTVMILRQKTDVTYADAAPDCLWAGIYLAETGVYTGKKIGNAWYLAPDSTLTESEFAAMCAALTGNAVENDSAEMLTFSRAAAILDESMALSDVTCAGEENQSVANVVACGLVEASGKETPFTVAEAVVLLARAGMLRQA